MLTVLQSGIAFIEDAGRADFTEYGVPISGALDEYRMHEANMLVGNPIDNPVIELHYGKFEFYCEEDTVFAVVGQGVSVGSDGWGMQPNMGIKVERFAFSHVSKEQGPPAYIAVKGFNPSKVLGSSSTDTFSKIGEEKVEKGNTYGMNYNHHDEEFQTFIVDKKSYISEEKTWHYSPVRMFETLTFDTGFTFNVSHSSRSGVTLSNPSLDLAHSIANMASVPVFPGVIQLPPDGNPIILSRDSGTTGGYPVVGVIYEQDLHKLGRIIAGDMIRLLPYKPSEKHPTEIACF